MWAWAYWFPASLILVGLGILFWDFWFYLITYRTVLTHYLFCFFFVLLFLSCCLHSPCIWQDSCKKHHCSVPRRVQSGVFVQTPRGISVRVGLGKRRTTSLCWWHQIQENHLFIRNIGCALCCCRRQRELHMLTSKQCRFNWECWDGSGCKRLVDGFQEVKSTNQNSTQRPQDTIELGTGIPSYNCVGFQICHSKGRDGLKW